MKVELGLCSSQRPGAIVCGLRDRYGAPLGSNITSKVALAKGDVGKSEARGHRVASFPWRTLLLGGAGPAYLWAPTLGSPWAVGHWKRCWRVGRAGGFDPYLCCSTPAARSRMRPGTPGKSLKLRWLHLGCGECFREGLDCARLESPLRGRALLASLVRAGVGCPAQVPLPTTLG